MSSNVRNLMSELLIMLIASIFIAEGIWIIVTHSKYAINHDGSISHNTVPVNGVLTTAFAGSALLLAVMYFIRDMSAKETVESEDGCFEMQQSVMLHSEKFTFARMIVRRVRRVTLKGYVPPRMYWTTDGPYVGVIACERHIEHVLEQYKSTDKDAVNGPIERSINPIQLARLDGPFNSHFMMIMHYEAHFDIAYGTKEFDIKPVFVAVEIEKKKGEEDASICV